MKVGVYARHLANPNQLDYVKTFFDFLRNQTKNISVHHVLHAQLTSMGYVHNFDTIVNSVSKGEIDILFSLGGDGTVLDTLSIVRDTETPVLGINLGRFGFLANSRQEDFETNYVALNRKDFTIDKRTVIELQSKKELFSGFPFGLNDVVIQKKDTSNMITVNTRLDNETLNSYWADGLILATPTGSTGYSLSCGGPIIYPGSASLVLTPIAPHNLSIRPLVIGDNKTLSFEVEGRSDDFLVTIDSRSETISKGTKLTVKKAGFKFHMIRLGDHSYSKTIRNKLLWGLDKRN
ncbi:MAG: NAD+ kinase [Bacteroidia bacterium]|jgi:NAD+ kinase